MKDMIIHSILLKASLELFSITRLNLGIFGNFIIMCFVANKLNQNEQKNGMEKRNNQKLALNLHGFTIEDV